MTFLVSSVISSPASCITLTQTLAGSAECVCFHLASYKPINTRHWEFCIPQRPVCSFQDAVLLNNVVQNFGMLDLVKKVLASHKCQMDRSREQYARDLAGISRGRAGAPDLVI